MTEDRIELHVILRLADIYRIRWEDKTYREVEALILKRSQCWNLAGAIAKNRVKQHYPDQRYKILRVIAGGKREDDDNEPEY